MEIRTVSGEELVAAIPALARLRMTVFRDYPYLYDGSEAYEAGYLRTYAASGAAMAVLAREGDTIVGASTGVPMAHRPRPSASPSRVSAWIPRASSTAASRCCCRPGAAAACTAHSSGGARTGHGCWAASRRSASAP